VLHVFGYTVIFTLTPPFFLYRFQEAAALADREV